MRSSRFFLTILRFLIGMSACFLAAISPKRAPAQDLAPEYRLCRQFHGSSDCIRFAPGCSGGINRRIYSGKELSCPALDARRCAALEKRLSLAASEQEGGDIARSPAQRPPVSCDGFSLQVPGHPARTACAGRDRKRSRALYELFVSVEGLCSP